MVKTKGTKEWADSNVNIYYGCENNCRYCYAKNMWIRFKGKGRPPKKWHEPELNKKAYKRQYRKRKGRVMFPTSHDITEKNMMMCYNVLKRLLNAGNEVLITTKPRLAVINFLTHVLKGYKEQIQWRFTITTLNNSKIRYWENKAPEFHERFASLAVAYQLGYKTSVSMEPFLDYDPTILISTVAPYCTESIWIGIMSNKHYEYHTESHLKDIFENINQLPEDIKGKVRIKDNLHNKCPSVRITMKDRESAVEL